MGFTFSAGVQIFSLLLWTGISIAMIVIGTTFLDRCLSQPFIPIYLIVAGVCHLAAIALLPLKLLSPKLSGALEGFVLLFSLCWLITGSVWTFPVYFTGYLMLCDSTLYTFTFSILIFQYVYLAVFSVTLLLVICFSGVKNLSKASLI